MSNYIFGDYVVYKWTGEVGRVVGPACAPDSYFVCWHSGCTAAVTQSELMRAATQDEINSAPKDIGYRRFDYTCPDADPKICGFCGHVKKKRYVTRTSQGGWELDRFDTIEQAQQAIDAYVQEDIWNGGEDCSKEFYEIYDSVTETIVEE